jgi:hypothetical protein
LLRINHPRYALGNWPRRQFLHRTANRLPLLVVEQTFETSEQMIRDHYGIHARNAVQDLIANAAMDFDGPKHHPVPPGGGVTEGPSGLSFFLGVVA